jgi:nucleotide-binding universal stress UspA family protein
MAEPGWIVVGTDGSERAERAVARAGQLAAALGVNVHVVSAYTSDTSAPLAAAAAGYGAPVVSDDGYARTRADQYADRAQQTLAELGVASETHVWHGEPADALVRIAAEQSAQMIVVGNRGMTGARRMLGSVPNRVSHHAGCDVVIVPT